MKPLILLAIVIGLASTSDLYTQRIETTLVLTNELNRLATVRFGIDSSASDTLDPSLGEFAFPGFPPPPSGLQAALVFRDDIGSILSYKDYRAFRPSRYFSIKYLLFITPATDLSRGQDVIFMWDYPLHPNIDSIVMTDLDNGLIKRTVFDSRSRDTLNGSATNLERFYINVYYNIHTTNLTEIEVGSEKQTTLIVSSDEPVIRLGEDIRSWVDSYSVYDLQGSSLLRGDGKLPINVSTLGCGIYFIVAESRDPQRRNVLSFIKSP